MEPQTIFVIILAGGMLLLLATATKLSGSGSLNIKSRTVGDGQHGTARWATPQEISLTYTRVRFKVDEWRKGRELPKVQGLILGSTGKKDKVTALIDTDDVHCVRFVS